MALQAFCVRGVFLWCLRALVCPSCVLRRSEGLYFLVGVKGEGVLVQSVLGSSVYSFVVSTLFYL